MDEWTSKRAYFNPSDCSPGKLNWFAPEICIIPRCQTYIILLCELGKHSFCMRSFADHTLQISDNRILQSDKIQKAHMMCPKCSQTMLFVKIKPHSFVQTKLFRREGGKSENVWRAAIILGFRQPTMLVSSPSLESLCSCRIRICIRYCQTDCVSGIVVCLVRLGYSLRP